MYMFSLALSQKKSFSLARLSTPSLSLARSPPHPDPAAPTLSPFPSTTSHLYHHGKSHRPNPLPPSSRCSPSLIMLPNVLPPSSGAQIPARSGETGHVDIAINLAELDPGRPGPRAAVVLDAVAVSSHSRETRGLSRAYPGGSTVGTTCTAYCWPLTASSWSTATPRSNLAALRKGD
ncbi:hypothetical protein VPH35_055509 [Triticum aestivum]